MICEYKYICSLKIRSIKCENESISFLHSIESAHEAFGWLVDGGHICYNKLRRQMLFSLYIVLGTFRWAESHQMLEYGNWNAGQPDDAEYYDGEDCVHISGKSGHNYKWNDLHCTWTGIWDIPTHALCQLNQ